VSRAVGPPIRSLRSVHSGHVGDYAAWFAVGMLLVMGLLALALR
jgi:hypothetical protein